MPAEGTELLENLAFDLAREAGELSGQLHPRGSTLGRRPRALDELLLLEPD